MMLILLIGKSVIKKIFLNNLEISRYNLGKLYFIVLIILGIIKTLIIKNTLHFIGIIFWI